MKNLIQSKINFLKLKNLLLLISLSSLFSCAHNPIQVENLPEWAHNDCYSDKNYYYFIGSARGDNLSEATTKALIDGKRKALLCLFGGKVESLNVVSRSISSIVYNSKSKLDIKIADLSWNGFSKVKGKGYLKFQDNYFALNQYKWPHEKISKELKKEIIESEVQKDFIRNQNNNTNHSYKNALDFFSKLQCGSKIADIFKSYKKPDFIDVKKWHPHGYTYTMYIYWGDVYVSFVNSFLDKYSDEKFRESNFENKESIYDALEKQRITTFYLNDTQKGSSQYSICNRDIM